MENKIEAIERQLLDLFLVTEKLKESVEGLEAVFEEKWTSRKKNKLILDKINSK